MVQQRQWHHVQHHFLPPALVASFHFLGASYITFVEGTAPAQPGHVGGKAAARAISIGGSRRVMSHWPFGRRVCPIFTRRVSSILLLFVRAAWLSFPEVASLRSWFFSLALFSYLSFIWSANDLQASTLHAVSDLRHHVPASLASYANTFYHCVSRFVLYFFFYNLLMRNKSFYDSKFASKNKSSYSI